MASQYGQPVLWGGRGDLEVSDLRDVDGMDDQCVTRVAVRFPKRERLVAKSLYTRGESDPDEGRPNLHP